MKRILPLALLVGLALPAAAQAAPTVTATVTCKEAVVTWSGFPDPVGHYKVTVDDATATDGQVTFWHTMVRAVPIALPDSLLHHVAVFGWWDASQYVPAGGSSTVPLATTDCGENPPPPAPAAAPVPAPEPAPVPAEATTGVAPLQVVVPLRPRKARKACRFGRRQVRDSKGHRATICRHAPGRKAAKVKPEFTG